MKKKILILAAIAATGSFGAYGTLAYFTATGTEKNVITAGTVNIELHEETTDGQPFPEDGIQNVMPGQVVDKIVFVENTGENQAWVRVKVEKKLVRSEPPEDEHAVKQCIKLDFNDAQWVAHDGWFYYKDKVDPGKNTEKLFTKVEFSGDVGNDRKNSTVFIDVAAQAVQCANNGESVMDADGWPAE